MFVFYKYKLGSTIINGRRIYGYMEKYPPTRVTWDEFRANKGNLIAATYTPELLSSLFPGSAFPTINFLYSDLRYLTYEQMCALCKAFGLTGRTNEKKRRILKHFLREYC
jgi:hypothetical protein